MFRGTAMRYVGDTQLLWMHFLGCLTKISVARSLQAYTATPSKNYGHFHGLQIFFFTATFTAIFSHRSYFLNYFRWKTYFVIVKLNPFRNFLSFSKRELTFNIFVLKGHPMRPIYRFLYINRFGTCPLNNCCSLCKTLTNCSESLKRIFSPASLRCHWLTFSSVHIIGGFRNDF